MELTRPDEGDYDLIAYVVFSKADYVFGRPAARTSRRFFHEPETGLILPTTPEDLIRRPTFYNIGFAGGELGAIWRARPLSLGLRHSLSARRPPFSGYRKDIFEKHGLKVPETYDEMLELACKIPELEPGMGGLATRGASGHHAAHAFLLHLAPLGGRVLDSNWNVTVNSEAGVAAAEALRTIVECGPEGAASFGFGEALNAFLQGDTAMYLDTTAIAGQINNPEPLAGRRQGRLGAASDGRRAAARRRAASASASRATRRTRKRRFC